jgi:hypothetical protein
MRQIDAGYRRLGDVNISSVLLGSLLPAQRVGNAGTGLRDTYACCGNKGSLAPGSWAFRGKLAKLFAPLNVLCLQNNTRLS